MENTRIVDSTEVLGTITNRGSASNEETGSQEASIDDESDDGPFRTTSPQGGRKRGEDYFGRNDACVKVWYPDFYSFEEHLEAMI